MVREGELRPVERRMIFDGEENSMEPMGTFVGTSPYAIKQVIINSIKKLLDEDIDESEINLEFFDYPLRREVPGIPSEEITGFRAHYKGNQLGLFELFVLIKEFYGIDCMAHLKYDLGEFTGFNNDPDFNNTNRFKLLNLQARQDHSIFIVI